MGALREIQEEQKAWLAHNFPNNSPECQLLGLVEEVGELAKAILKRQQGIRGTSDYWLEKERDAVGDILVFLLGHCNYRDWDLEEILEDVWTEVSMRDWIKYPKTGVPNAQEKC